MNVDRDGYVVKGYSPDSTTFKYFKAIPKQNDPSINIGGISESYVTWDNDKTYVPIQNVEYPVHFIWTKTQHISTETFDLDKFTKLTRPLLGGRLTFVRKSFDPHLQKKK